MKISCFILAAGLQCITRFLKKTQKEQAKENAVDKSNQQLRSLVSALHIGLKEEVYDKDALKKIELTRRVLDLPSLAISLKEYSFIKLACTEFPKFMEAVEAIPIPELLDLPSKVLKEQHRLFMQRLESMTKNDKIEDLKKTDPKELIKKLLHPSEELYLDIEMVMHAICTMCMLQSCESVLESMVSQYENHFDSRRNVKEDTANEEFNIAVNGPSLAHCDSVVREAMDNLWKHKKSPWNFIRDTQNKLENMETGSTVLKRLVNTKNKFSLMN